jgi:hypothetical protein
LLASSGREMRFLSSYPVQGAWIEKYYKGNQPILGKRKEIREPIAPAPSAVATSVDAVKTMCIITSKKLFIKKNCFMHYLIHKKQNLLISIT